MSCIRWLKCFIILLLFSLLFTTGCDPGFATGVTIGGATGVGAHKVMTDAQKSKAQLIGELQVTRAELKEAIVRDDKEKAIALEDKLTELEKKMTGVALAEAVSGLVVEGLGRDFEDVSPAGLSSNLHWGLEAVLGVLYLVSKRKERYTTKTLNKTMANATREDAEKIYASLKEYSKRIVV